MADCIVITSRLFSIADSTRYILVRPQIADGKQKEIIMAGVIVFNTLADALRAGYHVYDRTDHGYLVRTRTSAGWALAIVSIR